MKKIRVLILGATSHIAKGLIYNFNRNQGYELILHARSPQRLKDFLKENQIKAAVDLVSLDGLKDTPCELLINCVGIGTPNKVKDNPALIFSVTEDYDKIILGYLSRNKDARCVSFSSGAVYGTCFKEPVNEKTEIKYAVNDVRPQDYYGLAKVNSEVKHRDQRGLHIVDIRLFAYFSRFIDLGSGYFLTELIKAIKEDKELITDPCDFARDYLHPEDLFSLVELILKKNPLNCAFDAYSRSPVTKFLILDYFVKKYGLRYKVEKEASFCCPTGQKDIYYSTSKKAKELLGYEPKYASLEAVSREARYLTA